MLAAPYCLSLLLKRVAFRVAAHYPAEGVDEKQILRGIDEAFVAVPHVQVNHPVLLVRPDDREVAPLHDVFQAEGIHLP